MVMQLLCIHISIESKEFGHRQLPTPASSNTAYHCMLNVPICVVPSRLPLRALMTTSISLMAKGSRRQLHLPMELNGVAASNVSAGASLAPQHSS